jgi:hypothetical protein
MVAVRGRAFSSSRPPSQPHHVLFFEEKTARPESFSGEAVSEKSVWSCAYLCVFVSHFVDRFAGARGRKNRTKKITQIQSRKVHENLVGAQPAQLTFALFFAR